MQTAALPYSADPELAAEIRAGIQKNVAERNARDVGLADELASIKDRIAELEAELRSRSLA